MKAAIYAGSFDPWSFGHQYILDSALGIFDCVHILAAINPAKEGAIDPTTRARIIANAIDPFTDWWDEELPFRLGDSVVVSATTGLVMDYARENEINHIVRGLRSTTDFEAEFNLYFSNRAIEPDIQTWAIMSPPDLLHCSSTYVKTVVGQSNVRTVGTTFVAQSVLLKKSLSLGKIFDFIQLCSTFRFAGDHANNLTESDLNSALQVTYTALVNNETRLFGPKAEAKLHAAFQGFLRTHGEQLGEELQEGLYPEALINDLWMRVANAMPAGTGLKILHGLSGRLGKTSIPLFDMKAGRPRASSPKSRRKKK